MGFKIAIFSLNQWALDFEGNTDRILQSIDQAHCVGASLRAGPELEICGYSCEDAFFEQDTLYHSWTCLLKIAKLSARFDMIIDVGMPVYHSALYNCRVILYRGKIICIRAKTSLAKEGIYREYRHFTPWPKEAGLTGYCLPEFVAKHFQQDFVPFGANFILEIPQPNQLDTFRIGWEICQELWDMKNVSSELYQDFGCHLVINSSGSYWELRKLNTTNYMIKDICLRGGACYAFSNLVGCDGQRYVFHGRSCIYDRGELIDMTKPDDLFKEVQMVTHIVNSKDIEEFKAQSGIRSERSRLNGKTWNLCDERKSAIDIDKSYNSLLLRADALFCEEARSAETIRDEQISLNFTEEIYHYVSLWLWDYLRRSGMKGFMVPLSGGVDSTTVAMLVFVMSYQIYQNLDNLNVQEYFSSVHKIQNVTEAFKSPQDICKLILKCSYLATKYSSQETATRAKSLSQLIGAEFINLSLQSIYENFRDLMNPDSSETVTLLDQNLQARLRMTATYYISGGDRIVLATGNVDEALMGYLTKYDCSSADINPIGGLCKRDLGQFLQFCRDKLDISDELKDVIRQIREAPPSAELTGADQRDEDEIGLTYNEISLLGSVRRGYFACSGPWGTFEYLWRNRHLSPFKDSIRCLGTEMPPGNVAEELARLVKRFFQRYARNRHKLTVLTPALHAETYSPDDNRFDHRHFLYAPWTEQFKCIDDSVEKIKAGGQE